MSKKPSPRISANIDRRAEARWVRLDVALHHFQFYLRNKPDDQRYALSIIHLLYVSNFKGGNSSITEPMDGLRAKLAPLEAMLRLIGLRFEGKSLRDLSEPDVAQLLELAARFVEPSESFGIAGFGPSYASALLAAHFPDLLPVLDRRALNGAQIDGLSHRAGQVRNIHTHFEALIRRARSAMLLDPNLTLRELDKRWFCVPINTSTDSSPND